MAKQSLNLGTVPNDNTGDTLRGGGDKINDNFNEIYSAIGNGTSITVDGNDSQTLTSGNLLQQTTTVPSGISTKAYLQEPIMRLPATIAQEWEVQIETKQTINDVCIAQSIDEIKAT